MLTSVQKAKSTASKSICFLGRPVGLLPKKSTVVHDDFVFCPESHTGVVHLSSRCILLGVSRLTAPVLSAPGRSPRAGMAAT